MSLRRFLGVVILIIALAFADTVRATDRRCLGSVRGASLTSRLLDLSIIVGAAKLLDGSENPKLKEFLEWQLLSAAADARRYVDQGAVVDAASMRSTAPNWLVVVEKTRKYVKEHKLDEMPPREAEGDARTPLANLDRLKEWLSEQQKGRGE